VLVYSVTFRRDSARMRRFWALLWRDCSVVVRAQNQIQIFVVSTIAVAA
jgi:hypothetical protein